MKIVNHSLNTARRTLLTGLVSLPLLITPLSSCTDKDIFEKETPQTTCVCKTCSNNIPLNSFDRNTKHESRIRKSFEIKESDSISAKAIKRIKAAFLMSIVGSLVGIFRDDKRFITNPKQGAIAGAILGATMPFASTVALYTTLSFIIGEITGLMFSSGNEKIGHTTGAITAALALAATLL